MKLNQKIWNFIEKEKNFIFFIIITIIAWIIRILFISNISGDFNAFIEKWFYELQNNGGLYGLKLDIGDYNPPYLTILALLTYLPIKPIVSIKMVSIIFDYICALTMMRIVKILLKDNKNKDFFGLITYAVVLFLPTVILNSSCWGQADSIYVAFILISIRYLLEEKYLKAFIFLGISFAFKLQFIFILPLYILIYISERKFPIYYFLIIPLIDIIMCLPAMAFGKSILSCINIYINQTSEWGKYLSMNFPGIWNLLFPIQSKYNYVIATNENISKVGILITIFVYSMIAYLVLCKKIKFNKQKIIEFGLLSVMIATFLLPHMHDRYLFLGDILSILYYIYNKDKIYIPIGISLVSLYGYAAYLFDQKVIPIQYVSFIYFILLVIVAKDIYDKYFKEKISYKT